MNTSDALAVISLFFSIVFGVITVVLTAITIKNSQKLNDTNIKLAELDWMARTQKADVVIYFESLSRLIVKNAGNVEAYDINISIEGVALTVPDLSPITILAPGVELPYRVERKNFEGNLGCKGFWNWKNPDGSITKKESDFRLLG